MTGRRSTQRAAAGSVVDEVEPRIRELLPAYPRMPATVIAERIGWDRFDPDAQRAGARAAAVVSAAGSGVADDVCGRGDRPVRLLVPRRRVPVGFGQARTATALPVLTMVCGYSRWASAVLVPTRGARRICMPGWWQHPSTLGAVPRVLVWDGEGAVGRWRARQPELTAGLPGLPRHPGRQGADLQAGRPGSQGPGRTVPRLPGDARSCPAGSFTSPADFNTQLQAWLVRANHRQHRVLGCRPADRVEADTAAMLTLPPVAPVIGWRTSPRLPRDHYVRLDGNDYSVHPVVIGRRIEITADLDRVRVWCGGTAGRRP